MPHSFSDLDQLIYIVGEALGHAYRVHNQLGKKGLEKVKINRFGETALRGDVECEKAVLDFFEKERFPARVISEEHGVVNIGNPEFLVVLDGIDGSKLYQTKRGKGKYGTMMGVFEGTNPKYCDYMLSAIVQHATDRILMGMHDCGARQIIGTDDDPIKTSGQKRFDRSVKIYVDEFFYVNRRTFSVPLTGFDVSCRDCSCLYYADVAEGLAHFALECTRKGNLEIAAAYGLIVEAGGVMVDLQGNDIGCQKYLDFGQGKDEHIPVITAANRELADGLIAFLNKK